MSENKFDFEKVIKDIAELKRTLPIKIANKAQRYFAATFKQGGWEGAKWKEPKRKIPGTPEYKYPKDKKLQRRTKPTLVKSGILRRATSMSARVITWSQILLVVDVPYAQRHNEGLDGMPKRQFMGNSPILETQIKEMIEKEVDKVWQE